MKKKPFSIRQRITSFTYAFEGFAPVLRNEHNMYIHIAAALSVTILGFIVELSAFEWVAIVGVIGLVFICEFFNSAIEQLSNVVSPEKNLGIKRVKDISAAAVLISATTAVIIGLIIFIPKLFN